MNGLLTDLYELTMAAGYFAAGKTDETATFELSVRRLPPNRNFVVAAGLAQAADYLLNLNFGADEIDYLRGLAQFSNSQPEFFDYLSRFRFTGDLFAVPEGTPIFAGEPVLTVRASSKRRRAGLWWSSARATRIRPRPACSRAGRLTSEAAPAPAILWRVSASASRCRARRRIPG